MPYNYAGLGGTRVQNDLRVMGVYSGTSTAVFTSPMSSYPGGRSIAGQISSYSSTFPGAATDGFCYPLSTKTFAELYQQGGWACYWRAMNWTANSCTSAPIWDGQRYWLPTVSTITGNWIGQSTTGTDWNFVQVVGSQSGSSLNGYGIGFKGECLFTDIIGGVSTVHYSQGPNLMQTRAISAGAFGIFGGASSATKVAFCGGSGRIWVNDTVDGPWTEFVVGSAQWNAVANIPGTQTWIIVGASSTIARSTNDLATAPVAASVGVATYQGVAASSTAVIAVGSTTMQRSTDQGVTWQPVTGLPVTVGTLVSAAYGNGVFVVGYLNSPNVLVSTDDGLTWTLQATNFFPALTSYVSSSVTDGVRFANGKFLVVASANTQSNYVMAQSTDGLNWELVMSALPNPNGANTQYGTQGVFCANNVNGSPSSSSLTTGFHVEPRPPTQNSMIFTYNVGANLTSTQPVVGPNQWHEYQVVARPATTVNEWNLTYVVDGVVIATVTTTAMGGSNAQKVPWFTIARSAAFTYTQDVVFLDFPLDQDPGLLGPDLRIYYDQPAVDVNTEWDPSIDGAHNAEMVAVRGITNASTFVMEAGAPKTDQYSMQATNVPVGHSVLSTKTDAYFGRMQSGVNAVVTVGIDQNGTVLDSPVVSVNSPLNSWTYASKQQDLNPQTNSGWTRNDLNSMQQRISRVAPSAGGDPNWLNVGALLHFDGTSGATTTVDSSSFANPVTLVGSAVLSTNQMKFGATSLGLNTTGGSSDFVQVTNSPSITLGTGDFTVEMWVYQTVAKTGSNGSYMFASNISASSIAAFAIRTASTGALQFWQISTGSALWTSTALIPLNTWTHVALCRSGTAVTGFINGAVAATGTNGQNFDRTEPMAIGTGGSAAPVTDRWNGYIDEVRVTKGVARYTSNFTVPTQAFPNFY